MRPMILRSLLIVATPYRMKRVLQSHHSRRRSDFETFGSPNLSVFLIDLLSAGDSVYTRENLRVKIWGLPWKRVWYVRGFPSKCLSHLECPSIPISNLNLVCPFSIKLGNRDLENEINDCDLGRNHTPNAISCTEWCRGIECIKLQVSFRKRATKNRVLLRKMTCKDKASYASSPPCIYDSVFTSLWHNIDSFIGLFCKRDP